MRFAFSISIAASLAVMLAATQAASPLDDRDFLVAVESSIHRFRVARSYDQVLTPKHARLIRRLGCGRYDCRQDAEDQFRSEGNKAFRALLWGTWSADREIAARCRAISKRWYLCPTCNGTGQLYADRPCEWCHDGDTREAMSNE